MVDAIRVPVSDAQARGTSASIMYAIPEEGREQLNDLIAFGMTTEEALEVLARSMARRTERVVRETSSRRIANPFRTP